MGGKLTKEQQFFLGVLFAAGLVIWIYTVYLLNPIRKDIKTKESKYTDLSQQVKQAEIQARRLPDLKIELEKLEFELTSLEKQLPTQKDMPSILRIITKEALAQNIIFTSLRPLDPRRETYFDVIEFEMAMTGSLHSFARYVSALGQQERIFQVEQVKMASQGQADAQGNLPPLNISFQLKTYAYSGQ